MQITQSATLLWVIVWLCSICPAAQSNGLWYTYAVGLLQIGYAQVSYTAHDSGEVIQKKKVRFKKIEGQTEEEDYSAVLANDYSLRSAYLTIETPREKTVWIITASDKIVIQTLDKLLTLPGQKIYLEVEDFLKSLIREKLVFNKVYAATVLATHRKGLTRVKVRYLGQETISVQGADRPCHAFKVATEEVGNFWANAWFDLQGNLTGYRLGAFRLFPVNVACALQIQQERAALAMPFIFDPQKISRVDLKIAASELTVLPSGPYHTVKLPYVSLNRPPRPHGPIAFAELAKRQETYLHADTTIPSQHPLIVKYAEAARNRAPEPIAATTNIAQWIYRQLVFGQATPAAVEIAQLFGLSRDTPALATVAMCRASGIPARLMSGLVYYPGKLAYETWAEVWLKEWIPLYNGAPADCACLWPLFPDIAWMQAEHIPRFSLIIERVVKQNKALEIANLENYWRDSDGKLADALLGIACDKPAGWQITTKDLASDTLLFHSQQGSAMFLKVFALPKPLTQVLQSLQDKMGNEKSLEVVWQQPRGFPGGEGIEVALKSQTSSMLYRAFVAEQHNKGVLVLLVISSENELREAEHGFQAVIASLRLNE